MTPEEEERGLEEILERSAARTIDGNYALWNALLTMDTIVITVFTAGLVYVEKDVQKFLLPCILLALVSAALLIANFRSSRDAFKNQGILAQGLVHQLSRIEKARVLKKTESDHNWRVRRERAVEIITILQGLFITALVVYITCFDKS